MVWRYMISVQENNLLIDDHRGSSKVELPYQLTPKRSASLCSFDSERNRLNSYVYSLYDHVVSTHLFSNSCFVFHKLIMRLEFIPICEGIDTL